jgi:hypothetical protein
MMALFKKTWTIFTWIVFTIGVVGCVLMLWSKLWPSLNWTCPVCTDSLETLHLMGIFHQIDVGDVVV